MVEFKPNFSLLFKSKDWVTLKHSLTTYDAHEIAQFMEEITENEEVVLFRLLHRAQAKEVFQLLTYKKQEQIIEGLANNSEELSNLLSDIEPDDRTAFFEELPGQVTQRLIQYLSPKERSIATRLLGYPENSIGRLMTPEYVALKSHYTIAQSFEHIRRFGQDSETLNVVYIVDKDWKLIDDLRIKEIILATPDQLVSDLMDNRIISLNALDDQEAAIKTFQDYDRVALPVVNDEGVLLGIVTIDDIMDVVQEESTEDFHKFGSIQTAIANPLKERVFDLYKNRIVWLIVLVFVNVFSGAAISNFEQVIQQVVSLVFFLPLLIDSGGNAGSQSATLMIRSMAIGDVQLSDWYKLIGKEVLVSFFLGLTMAAGVSLVAAIRSPEIILVVSVSMLLTVMVGSLIGLLLPFVFTKLKLDPATASAPLITSIADICGVLIYFSMAAWYFNF